MHARNTSRWLMFAALAWLAQPALLEAGVPLVITKTGEPYRWDASHPIPVNPDRGRLGRFSNTDAIVQLIVPALAPWAAVPTARINWVNGGVLSRDIETLEDLQWALSEGYNPIVFDQGGKIIAELGLSTQSVIAIAAPFAARESTIVQGFIIINGLMVDGNSTNGEMSAAEMITAITHEVGHFLNLDHSQVNGHMFFGDTNDPAYKTFGPPPADSVEIMYPFFKSGVGAKGLTRDDQAGISMLYPADSFLSNGSISGQVFRADRSTPLQGANLVARNARDPYYDAVSTVSGCRYIGQNGGSYDLMYKGLFEIVGLSAGSSYLLEMVNLLPVESVGSSTGPLFPHLLLPGPEEFYNGAFEGSTDPPDNPMERTELQIEPGGTLTGINMYCNRALRLPVPVTYGQTQSSSIDNGTEAVSFTFTAQAGDFASVEAEASGCCVNPVVEVYSPDGVFLGSASGWPKATVRQLLISSGTYAVVVTDKSLRWTGKFTLTVRQLWNMSSAAPIDFGLMKSGSLSADGAAIYEIHANQGDTLALRIVRSSGSISPRLELYDPAGMMVAQQNGMSIARIDIKLPRGGRHILVVTDRWGGAGAFGLTVQRLNNPGNAQALAFGQTRSDSVSGAGEADTYVWSANAGDVLTLRAVRSSGSSVYPVLELYDLDGSLVKNNYGSSNTRIDAVLSKSGRYLLLLTDQYGTGTGAYGLSMQRLNNPGSATPLTFGQTRAGSLATTAEMPAFTWMANAGDRVSVRMTRASGSSVYPHMELYDGSGVLVNKAYSFGDTRLDAVMTKTGLYVLLTSDEYGTGIGGYGLSMQRMNNPGNLVNLAFGQARAASITTIAEMATYAWAANAGDRLTFWAARASGSNVYPQLELYDPDGILVKGNYGYGNVRLDAVSAKSGQYIVLAMDHYGSGTGAYGLSGQRLNDPGSAAAMIFGQAQRGTVAALGQLAAHTWNGTAGDAVTLRMVRISGSLVYPQMELYDTDGVLVNETTGYSDARLDAVLPKNGRYTLIAYDHYGTGTGGYDLSATCTRCQPWQAEAASTLYFPYLKTSAAEIQGVAICNLTQSASTVRLSAYIDSSGVPFAQMDQSLRPNGQMAQLASELFGSGILGKRGWIAATSNAPSQRGFFLSFDPMVSWMDGSNVSATVSNDFILAEMLEEAGSSVELNLVNPSSVPAAATLELVDLAGKVREIRAVQIAAKSAWWSSMDAVFSPLNITSGSYVRCKSDIALAGLQLLRRAGSLAMSPGIALSRAAATLYSPQLAAGGGYYTRLSIVNLAGSSTSVTITALDEEGKPHAEADVNPIVRQISAGGKLDLDVGSAFGFGSDLSVHTGWLKITCDSSGNIAGSASFGDSNRASSTSLPLLGTAMNQAVFSHIAQNDWYFTGIALLNLTSQPARATLQAFDRNGTPLGSATISLNPGERVSKLVSELTSIRNQVGGFIRIDSDRDLIMFSIFGTSSLSVLSAIPAQPVR